MTFLEHIGVLRWHLVRSAIIILAFAIVAFVFPEIIFDEILLAPKNQDFITYRMLCQLADITGVEEIRITDFSYSLQSIKLAAQFTTHIWVSVLVGFVLAFPYVIWEVWRFIKPALKENERKNATGFVLISSILFLIGVAFGYFIISPMAVNFLGTYKVSQSVANNISFTSFISTVTTSTLSTGLVFELPIVIYFLSRISIVTPKLMRHYRRHAIVVVFILSAVITPSTDMISQILVAVPLLILYEISISVSARVVRKRK
ncbi:MAG: twin-arginine translocase subunit TatC [Bacteroidetes bacterium]|nr:twin-arginine translocase subunit TatC [Bacteroidota bacterium]MBU1718782.1 twin-arginine translocase subunit TatC [Bacteroidota bacterium]